MAVEPVNVLTLNSGSSSLKFGLYSVDGPDPQPLFTGAIETVTDVQVTDQIAAVLDRVGISALDAIGHRIVHGGPTLRQPCRIDSAVLQTLEAAIPFAPLHLPAELALVHAAAERLPEVPQIACFDTGFHAAMPEIATTLPLAAEVRREGVQRYGFHGLSCQSIVRQLGANPPDRLIIAHLGNGASVTAVKAGCSIDTSMGLTPSGGVIMGTRAGDLDPGVLVYLLRELRLDAAALETMIDTRSGLLGISGLSNDLRTLRASAATNPCAALALAMFARSVAKQIGALIVSLGGIDALVFTGGIGEKDRLSRAAILADLAAFGLAFDDEHNVQGSVRIEAAGSRAAIHILPAREDEEIARAVQRVVSPTSSTQPTETIMANYIPGTMQAARIHATGGSDQMRIETVPTPRAEGDHVLVRIEVAGINPIDWKIRDGERPVSLPMTLGHDCVGRVAAMGPRAGDHFGIGDRVYAMIGEGAFAEFVAVPVGALALAPAGLSVAEAAAVPMGALTAWKALFEIAHLKAGERVLIHGAGGAVGGEAAQFAKHAGAWVAATASGEDLARLRKLGLDMIIDYKSEDFSQLLNGDKGVDLVLDVLGGETRDRSWPSIRDGGRMVSTLGRTEPPAEAAARGIKGLPGWGATPDGARLAQVTALFDEGVLTVTEPRRFAFANIVQAMDAAEHGRAGKIVVDIGA